MLKKLFLSLFMLLILLVGMPINSFAYEREVWVTVNGEQVTFPDIKPFIDEKTQRTMIPLRFLSQKMGATVNWDDALQQVVINKSEVEFIILPVHQKRAYVNGKVVLLDSSAILYKGRTMVPLRFVSEALEATVQWDEATNTVKVTTASQEDKQPENIHEDPNSEPILVDEPSDLPFYLEEEATGKGIKVAVIDSGISPHPDLKIAGGKNFVEGEPESYEDLHGHGTMVAGILAGKKFGVAKDVELYALRALDKNNRGYGHWFAKAVDWAIEHDIDIINMSIGMDVESSTLNSSLEKALKAGIIIVASAGNDGGVVRNPASFDGVISVGALNSDWQTRASFSNHIGKVDYYAVGTDIKSTNPHGSYFYGWRGTSFASPYVAGMFALYKEAFPHATADELKQLMLANATSVPNHPDWKIPQKPQYERKILSIPIKDQNGTITGYEDKSVLIPIFNIK